MNMNKMESGNQDPKVGEEKEAEEITEEEIKAVKAEERKVDPTVQEERLKEVAEYMETPGGMDKFVKDYVARFQSMIGGMLGNSYKNDVEDVMQTVALKTSLNLKHYNGTASLRTWIHKIVVNEVSDYFRKVKSKKRDVTDSLDDVMDEELGSSNTVSESPADRFENGNYLVWEALSSLKPQEELLVRLRHLDGYSPPEIAEMLGIPENTVKVRSYRILKKIRKILAKKGVSRS